MISPAPYEEPPSPLRRLFVLSFVAQRSASEAAELKALASRLGLACVRTDARHNQIESLVGDALLDVVPELIPEDWRLATRRNERRVTMLIESLGEVCSQIERVGSVCAAIEAGGVLLGSSLPSAQYCPSDIDLLVGAGDLDVAHRVLLGAGYVQDKRAGRTSTSRREYKRASDAGTLRVEVAAVAFERSWSQLSFVDRTRTWLASRQPSPRCSTIPILMPAHALALVSFHTSLHSFVRAPGLRLQLDVHRLVVDNAIDWAAYLEEVQRSRICTRAFVTLSMAAGLLGTPIPNSVLAALAPPSWRWSAIREMLQREGVLATAQPKLTGLRAVLLDLLLADDGRLHWLRKLALPDRVWLADRFGDPQDSFVQLHIKRASAVVARWRPR